MEGTHVQRLRSWMGAKGGPDQQNKHGGSDGEGGLTGWYGYVVHDKGSSPQIQEGRRRKGRGLGIRMRQLRSLVAASKERKPTTPQYGAINPWAQHVIARTSKILVARRKHGAVIDRLAHAYFAIHLELVGAIWDLRDFSFCVMIITPLDLQQLLAQIVTRQHYRSSSHTSEAELVGLPLDTELHVGYSLF
ncbi:uncharacterized protein KY384_006393 [Bacidia gigantensis]|uniref:uncharacterized protein n=1 Tax=Bacidia gigantensis TaxID=2732470 RepID=UPI001D03D9CD|nr:uncharacterized protein KY384_006393 [Bacidia gigantensis]KAG8528706.1 hypothetical protein KY384_006393 [Bacidia gigantensis]